VLLAVMATSTLVVGMWASLAPRSFYDDFPGAGRHWVALDGPFNEHLVRDVGTLGLALAAVTVAALVRPERYLVTVTAGATLLYSVPHFGYHAFHLDLFQTADQVGQMVSLAVTVLAPAALLFRALRPEPAAAAQAASPTWR